MSVSRRLPRILHRLSGGAAVTAARLADEMGVSVRTIWRDMDRIRAQGIAIEGTPGKGYRLAPQVLLPPLSLTPQELEALQLGLAILQEAQDGTLRAVAQSLAVKIEHELAVRPMPAAMPAGPVHPVRATRVLAHLPTLRAAILARQFVRLRVGETQLQARPLALDVHGRIWTLTVWDESGGEFALLRVDEIDTVAALPSLFSDVPGKSLAESPFHSPAAGPR